MAATVPSGFHSGLRLRRDEPADGVFTAGPAPTLGKRGLVALPQPMDVLREARRSVLMTYGPCCAASETLVLAWARRAVEVNETLPLAAKLGILTELAQMFGGPFERPRPRSGEEPDTE